jgi:ATP-dependent exoDNAse (exonuclease V) beta subunit
MIVAPHEKGKHLMQWSGLLRASLADGKPLSPGTIAYEKGDSKWFQKLVPADHDQAVESSEILPAFPALKLGPARPKAENAERVAPSRKAHSDTVSARSLLESSSTRGEYGTVIHFWFEQIQWLEDAPLDESVTRLHHQARQLVPHRTQQEISKWWESFQRYLDKPRVADLLKRDSYEQHNPLKLEPPVRDRIAVWQVECERPVHFFRSQDELTVGVIDRLVLGLDEAGKVAVAQIIDYKTDRLDSAGDLVRLGSEYQIQLDAYADVIAQLFQLDRTLIDTELVFLRSI